MLNPMTRWEPGAAVRYHGSHTSLHGTYQAHICDCLDCDDPRLGGIRFKLIDADGRTVLTCVRPRSLSSEPGECDGQGEDADPHAGCIEPHKGSAGEYVDCDGRPL